MRRGDFDSRQILNVSEIGLPSEDVVGLANELCTRLGLSVFMQQPNENFTPVGDDNGLFILPVKDRIWKPNSGVPAKLLPVKVKGRANGKEWEVRGYPLDYSWMTIAGLLFCIFICTILPPDIGMTSVLFLTCLNSDPS